MKIFGKGKGFLGLSKRHNWVIDLLSVIIFIWAIAYFISIEKILISLGIFVLWILVMIDTHKDSLF